MNIFKGTKRVSASLKTFSGAAKEVTEGGLGVDMIGKRLALSARRRSLRLPLAFSWARRLNLLQFHHFSLKLFNSSSQPMNLKL